MPDKEPNLHPDEKPCRRCGRTEWRYAVIGERVDPTGLFTWAQRDVEYRICPCGYKERGRLMHQDNTPL